MPKRPNVPAAIRAAPTCARAAHTARSIAPGRQTVCVAAPPNAAMTPNGAGQGSASCSAIPCAQTACRKASSRRPRSWTTSSRTGVTGAFWDEQNWQPLCKAATTEKERVIGGIHDKPSVAPRAGQARLRLRRRTPSPPRHVLLCSSISGKSVTARSAIQLSTVYACVRVIAETVASLPLNVFEATDKGEGGLHGVSADPWRDPRPSFHGKRCFPTCLVGQLVLPDPPHRAQRHRRPVPAAARPHGGRPRQRSMLYHQRGPHGTPRPTDVLHIPGLGFDGVMGYSPIALEKSAVGLSIAAEEYWIGLREARFDAPRSIFSSILRESWNGLFGGFQRPSSKSP